jgi:hypothetical protein
MKDKVFTPGELTDEIVALLLKESEQLDKDFLAEVVTKGPVVSKGFPQQSRILVRNPNKNHIVSVKISVPFPFQQIELDHVDPTGGVTYTSFSVIFLTFRQIYSDPMLIVQNLSTMASLRVFIVDYSENSQSYKFIIGPQESGQIWLDKNDQAIVIPSHYGDK